MVYWGYNPLTNLLLSSGTSKYWVEAFNTKMPLRKWMKMDEHGRRFPASFFRARRKNSWNKTWTFQPWKSGWERQIPGFKWAKFMAFFWCGFQMVAIKLWCFSRRTKLMQDCMVVNFRDSPCKLTTSSKIDTNKWASSWNDSLHL